eukprot:4431875-Heterocapsa_arctica.AAC.1
MSGPSFVPAGGPPRHTPCPPPQAAAPVLSLGRDSLACPPPPPSYLPGALSSEDLARPMSQLRHL